MSKTFTKLVVTMLVIGGCTFWAGRACDSLNIEISGLFMVVVAISIYGTPEILEKFNETQWRNEDVRDQVIELIASRKSPKFHLTMSQSCQLLPAPLEIPNDPRTQETK